MTIEEMRARLMDLETTVLQYAREADAAQVETDDMDDDYTRGTQDGYWHSFNEIRAVREALDEMISEVSL